MHFGERVLELWCSWRRGDRMQWSRVLHSIERDPVPEREQLALTLEILLAPVHGGELSESI
jgi:hypothetical protein